MNKEKSIAKESDKTQKAREKLKRNLERNDKKVTKEELDKKLKEIYSWIARYSSHRMILKDKHICLFDENQNTAKLSKYVSEMIKKLQQECFLNMNKKPSIDLKKITEIKD
jgi:lysyl-tRNA synthetase class I